MLDQPHALSVAEALRESEKRYRWLLENTTEAIWRFELERPVSTALAEDAQIEGFYQAGYLAECNPAMAAMYGFASPSEMIGLRLGDLMPPTAPENIQYLRAFIRSGYRLVDAESVEVGKDGRVRYLLNNLVGEVVSGRTLRAWGTSRDLTAQKQAEEKQALLLRQAEDQRERAERALQKLRHMQAVSDAALTHLSLDSLLEELLARISEALNADTAVILLLDEDRHLHERAAKGLNRGVLQRVRIPLGAGFAGRVAQERQPVYVADVSQHDIVSPVLREKGLVSLLGIPLLVKNRLIGVLHVGWLQAHPHRLEEVQLLEVAADRAAQAIEHARLYEAQSEAREEAERERDFLRAILDHSPTAIFLKDREGRYQVVNRQCQALFGLPAEQVLGKTDHDLLPPDTADAVRSHDRQVLEAGVSLAAEESLLGPNGVQTFLSVKFPLLSRAGEPAAVGGVSTDITERKRAQEGLEESECRFRQLAENIREVFWIYDAIHRCIVYVSPAYETVWGRTCQSAYEQPLPHVAAVHPEDRERVALSLERHQRGEETEEEYRVERPDGTIRWVRDRAFPLRDEQGRVYRVVGVAEDITQSKRASDGQKFLVGASRLLASSLNYERTLEHVARLVVPRLADWCTVHLADEHGTVRLMAVEHADPEKVRWARELQRRYPYDPTAPSGVPHVLRTGQPELYPEIPDALLVQSVKEPERLELLRRVGMTACMIVPLQVRDRVLGAVTLISAESGHRYGPEDLQVAEDLASRASAAIENAWLYRQAQESVAALRENEARLGGIIGSAMDAILTINEEQRITVFNQAAERMFQCPASEALGQPLDRFIPGQYREAHREYVRGFSETGVSSRSMGSLGTLFALRTDGEEFPIEATISQVEVHGEKLYTVIVRDVTQRVRLEAELREQAERLAEADRRKDEFLAMLAHELRNPLAPILNAVEIMRARPNRVLGQGVREVIDRQVRHMARLVDDLLDVSRITRGKTALHKQPVEIGTAVANAVETSRPLIEARRHHLSVSLPSVPLRLEADPTRLEQVLTNLLNNAAKYTEPGGRIWLRVEREDGQAVLRVRDTGMGISPALLPRVFDLFTQADRSLDRAQGGLGVGLTLVRSLVEMHGGSVEVYSEGPGRGSEFIVQLPLLTDPPGEILNPLPEAEPSAEKVMQILVVDDNVDAAQTLRDLLELWGHEVTLAYDGPAALELASRSHPRVVLLDIGLPGMDGYEVARHLRQGAGLTGTVLVALTGYGQEEDRRRSERAGFDHHLVKPVDPAALQRLVAGLS